MARTTIVGALLVCAGALAACGYNPHFVSGVTRCADAPPLCPGGFTCDTARGVCVNGISDGGALVDVARDLGGGTGGGVGGSQDAGGVGGAGGATDGPRDTAIDASGDAGSDAATCTNIASSPDDCGACGHSCGGGMCSLGVCQPATLTGITGATSLSVDTTRVYYSTGNKLLACPKSGCVLAPDQIDDMGTTGYPIFAVNVTNGSAFFMSAPTQSTERDYLYVCPLAGCPSPVTAIGIGGFGVSYLGNSGNDVYWSEPNGRTTSRRTCQPNGGACDAPVTVITMKAVDLHLFAASSTELYFADTVTGLQKCPWSGCVGSPPVTTSLTSMIPTAVLSFGGKIWMQFGDAQHTLNGAIRTCDPIDCNAHVPAPFITGRDPLSGLHVDADGVYWLEDNTLYSCPNTGCVGGAKTRATGVTRVANPNLDLHLIVTDSAFIYWINDDVGTVKRLAK
jgi:hypothetical protein